MRRSLSAKSPAARAPSLTDVLRAEYDARRAREAIARCDIVAATEQTGPARERAVADGLAARRGLVRARLRGVLAELPDRERLLDRLDGWLTAADLDRENLDALIDALAPEV